MQHRWSLKHLPILGSRSTNGIVLARCYQRLSQHPDSVWHRLSHPKLETHPVVRLSHARERDKLEE